MGAASGPSPRRRSARTTPGDRRGAPRRLVALVVTGALTLASCGSGDGAWIYDEGQPDVPELVEPIGAAVSAPLAPIETLVAAPVGPAGGTVTVPTEDPSLGGVDVTVPAGALATEIDVSISATTVTPGTPLPDAEAVGLELIARALRAPELAIHPMAAPAITGQGLAAVTTMDLQPSGTEFAEPVAVTIPGDLLQGRDGEALVAVMRSDIGGWEILGTPARSADGSLTIEVDHFSALGVLAVGGALLGLLGAACGYLCPEYFQGEAFDDAYERLKPLNHRHLLEMAQAMVCSEQTMSARGDGVPESLWDVVGDLYVGSSISPSGHEAELESWIRGIAADLDDGRGRPNGLGQYELLRRSLELNGGNVFHAITTVQNVLSANRNDPAFDKTIQFYRFDEGGDVRGARYHFWGMIAYSYIAEDRFGSSIGATLSDPFNNPQWAATFEEWWGNDIWTDPTEYAVDIVGAELGAEFYELAGLSLAEIATRFDIDPNECPELPMPSTTVAPGATTTTPAAPVEYAVWRITNYGGAQNGYLRVAPVDYDVDPPLLSVFPGGGIDPDLRATPVRVDAGATFATEEEAAQSMCSQLDDFFRPALASFILQAYEGGNTVSVDGIFQDECT